VNSVGYEFVCEPRLEEFMQAWRNLTETIARRLRIGREIALLN
jgi:hypothetical protein